MILDMADEDYHMMDWWISFFGPYWWIFMAIGGIIFIITSIIIAYYIHRDAIRLGIHNSEFWLVIGLLFNIIGLIIYLLVRNNYKIQRNSQEININK